jgi:hypothetical protein
VLVATVELEERNLELMWNQYQMQDVEPIEIIDIVGEIE